MKNLFSFDEIFICNQFRSLPALKELECNEAEDQNVQHVEYAL